MPDFPRPFAENGSDAHYDPVTRYSIRRKGSVYNIVGPEGRVFTKYKSASVVGPRWEELTETPWPYPSTAYEPGTRLWQLGLIDRNDVGKTDLSAAPEKPKREHVHLDDAPEPLTASQANDVAAQSPTAKTSPELKPLKTPARQLTLLDGPADSPVQPPALTESASEPPVSNPVAKKPVVKKTAANKPVVDKPPVPSAQADRSANLAQPAPVPASPRPAKKKSRSASTGRTAAPRPVESPAAEPLVLPILMTLALPAPRINLDEQTQQIQTLRRSPQMLFDPKIRVVLQREVEYHRPYARWAQTLLTMLARYDKRQQRARAALDPQTILARHIAWQEEQLRSASTSTSH